MLARIAPLLLAATAALTAQPLPGTAPLTSDGDLALQMVEGMRQWLADEAPRTIPKRPPTVERLRYILGVVDERVPFTKLATEPVTRWPVLPGVTAEGLHLAPKGPLKGRVVLLADAGQLPTGAQELAQQGYEVLAPVLLDRADTWSGNPAFRMTNQPHREFVYRMAFPLGRHIIGYEIQKVLAAVDYFAQQSPPAPISVRGYGEGAAIAFYAGAIDLRIASTEITGYFGSRAHIAEQPIDRNVWTLRRDFGDAEVATLYRGRALAVAAGGPTYSGPPAPHDGRAGAAPGTLAPVSNAEIDAEIARAAILDAKVEKRNAPTARAGEPYPPERIHQQLDELIQYTQRLVRAAQREREKWWAAADRTSPERWTATTAPHRERILDDLIGRLPASATPPNPRTRLRYHSEKWDGYEVQLDVLPHVYAYGVLLVPKNIPAGRRLATVVAQHGLNGRPQDLFQQNLAERPGSIYQNFGGQLADLGYVVFMPQNPYIGDFRQTVRMAHPWGLTLYSFIQAQNRRIVDWLITQPFVDAKRIGYYGLSYGGKTALRIPQFDERFALSICSGDFNEWVRKLATYDEPFSYIFTNEYEMGEYNLAHIADHAEMAWLMAPRPFMVERGHNDGVGVDEWVSFEYARVRRFYDQLGLGDRSAIEYFNGPHQIHGVGTFAFLRRWLGAP